MKKNIKKIVILNNFPENNTINSNTSRISKSTAEKHFKTSILNSIAKNVSKNNSTTAKNLRPSYKIPTPKLNHFSKKSNSLSESLFDNDSDFALKKSLSYNPPSVSKNPNSIFDSDSSDSTIESPSILNSSSDSNDETNYNLNLEPGELVLALKNTYYYPAMIISFVINSSYKLKFYDGSYAVCPRSDFYTLYEPGFISCKIKEDFLKSLTNPSLTISPQNQNSSNASIDNLRADIEKNYKSVLDKLWDLPSLSDFDHLFFSQQYDESISTKIINNLKSFYHGNRFDRRKLYIFDKGSLSYDEFDYVTILLREWYPLPPILWSTQKSNAESLPQKHSSHTNSLYPTNEKDGFYSDSDSSSLSDLNSLTEPDFSTSPNSDSNDSDFKPTSFIKSKFSPKFKNPPNCQNSGKYNKKHIASPTTRKSNQPNTQKMPKLTDLPKSLPLSQQTSPQFSTHLLSLGKNSAAEQFIDLVLVPTLIHLITYKNSRRKKSLRRTSSLNYSEHRSNLPKLSFKSLNTKNKSTNSSLAPPATIIDRNKNCTPWVNRILCARLL
ncbi:hypothetical protein AYI70_g1922 [Smittium culicis]|uniref:Tudor domain-containing protein n=1 Tax=Smittium culicis TaxID=133412 RepID=A0A1R1YAL6_9FUNG|nr:hypothetical protein AYI70_g1922 [Smittium culicis]